MLRDESAAEDAVQDAILVAIEREQQFSGHASIRTWTTTILRNRIHDHYRRAWRELPFDDDPGTVDARGVDALFDARGNLLDGRGHWAGDPESVISQQQFLDVLEICVNRLPARSARVFLMHEWLEISTEEICHELNISSSNCGVILHRAKARLRECLERSWVGAGR